MSLMFTTTMRSETGPHRSSNQDSVACTADVVLVADGVGGHAAGDVASWTVTHRLMSMLAHRPSRELDVDELREVIAQANADLALRTSRDPSLAGMATTFTGLFGAETAVRVAHIGDSRAYLVRDGEGRRVTRDDSLVQMLVDSGTIDEADADHHPHRNVILRSLAGRPDDADGMTILSVPAGPGDRWLVASDGLTDAVPDSAIVAILLEEPDLEAAADRLVQAALDADSRDNITVAVADVVEADDGGARRAIQYLGAAASEDRPYIGDLSAPPPA